MMHQFYISDETKQDLETLRAPFEKDDALFKRLISAYQAMLNTPESAELGQKLQLESKSLEELAKYGQILYTFSTKKKPFAWSLEENTITIYRIDLPPHTLYLTKLITILKDLNLIYPENYFELDNNVSDVKNHRPDHQTGFGRMIYKHTENTSAAQISSQLGPILHKYGILKWNEKPHGIGFKCTEIVNTLTVEKLKEILSSDL